MKISVLIAKSKIGKILLSLGSSRPLKKHYFVKIKELINY